MIWVSSALVRQSEKEAVLKVIEDYCMIDAGVTEVRARAGAVVVLSEEMRRCVKSWKCVSERIVVVKLKVGKGAAHWCKCIPQCTTVTVRPKTSFMRSCRRL